MSQNFERNVSWQIVDIDSPISDWHDAPILYISGAKASKFSKAQIAKLREFVLQGGTILSEAAGNSGDFTLDMQNVYREMFPDRPLQRLADDHPIYNMYFQPKGPSGVAGISNGVRTMVLHSPRELSKAMQIGQRKDNKAWFELLANICFLATDKGILSRRGVSHFPKAKQFEPTATIALARLKYDGNHDPEPMGWERLRILMGNRYRIDLRVSESLEIEQLDAKSHPIAAMTGTGDFTLSEAERKVLKKYFRKGGTLIIDAAGGSRKFNRSVEKQIINLPDNGIYAPLGSIHPIYHRPAGIGKVTYRRDFALALGESRNQPLLRVVVSGERFAIIHSREDLSAALVGYQHHGIRGYSPKSAEALMTNILCYAAGVVPEFAVTPTATAPAHQEK
jgi:hypothetical protein